MTRKIDVDKGDKKLSSLINLGTLNPGPDPPARWRAGLAYNLNRLI